MININPLMIKQIELKISFDRTFNLTKLTKKTINPKNQIL